MLNRRISENLKEEIAKELGLYEIVKKAGWNAVTSRASGNLLSQSHAINRSQEKEQN